MELIKIGGASRWSLEAVNAWVDAQIARGEKA
jgi:predicted DNA-binding transcriptional regulator AlpA